MLLVTVLLATLATEPDLPAFSVLSTENAGSTIVVKVRTETVLPASQVIRIYKALQQKHGATVSVHYFDAKGGPRNLNSRYAWLREGKTTYKGRTY